MSFSTERYAALFAEEAREHLAATAAALLDLERSAAAGLPVVAAVDAAFRAVHTVKGMSATMGYAVVERVAHELEHVLARVRADALPVDAPLVDALLRSADALELAVAAAVAGASSPDVAAALDGLAAYARHDDAPSPARAAGGSAPARPADDAFRLTVRVAPDAALPGVRAFMVLQRAASLGALHDVRPAEPLQDPTFDGTLRFALRPSDPALDADAIAAAVRAVGEIAEVEVAAPSAAATVDPRVDAPAAPAPPTVAPSSASPRQVRLDAARLDALLDLAAELVTTRGRIATAAASVGDAVLAGAVADLGRLVGALHEQVLESRLVPVGEVFDRMPRLVRDAARATGKQVTLETEGADVAVDRAVLDALGEPLGHLLRNAVDHGIEPPDLRRAAGKPAAGRVTLRAARDRDAVEVAVVDDGRGIDTTRVLARARQARLVDVDVQTLDDERLLSVLAHPGFSTAEQVTAVSGRGVGMDAVLARVRAVGGTLALRSVAGAGTTWLLRLPLTLAVTRALLAEGGDGVTYALPLTHVRETLDVPDDLRRGGAGAPAIDVRGERMPLLPLHAAVAGRGADAAALAGCTEAAVVEAGGRRIALAVPGFGGQPDLVVKRLPAVRGTLRIFGGATILESGAVALIVDVPALLTRISPRSLS